MIFKINKPLIPLKISLFLWYGGGAVIQNFLWIYLRQRGISIAQVTVINALSPVFLFFGPTMSGIIADKIGKSKPVLFGNLILVLLAANGLFLIPYSSNVQCTPVVSPETESNIWNSSRLELDACTLKCESNEVPVSEAGFCSFVNSTFCRDSSMHQRDHRVSLDFDEALISKCSLSGFQVLFGKNTTWCDVPRDENCSISETLLDEETGNNNAAFAIAFVLMSLFYTTFSNCYRFMDVTAMSMVNTYNSDFGRERFWCIIGTLILSPLSGYIVKVTTPLGGLQNYMTAFYMFDVMVVLTMFSVWKLEVEIKPKGKRMWKQTMLLLKNPDVVSFALTIFVLGTTWGFCKLYTSIYLEKELKATSMAIALMPAVNSAIGIPFLLTSNWWIKKLGTRILLLLAFAAYTVKTTGYSYIQNPWMSLLCEINVIFTYHLLWVTVIRHSHEIAPESLTATVISTAGGIHYGVGKGTGSIIGGTIMDKFGGRWAYRVFACICATCFVLYAIFLLVRRKYVQPKTDIQLQERSKKNSSTLKDVPQIGSTNSAKA